MSDRATIKNILIRAYNNHALERDTYQMDAWKIEERANFLVYLQARNKQSLLEIGAGTGRDSKFFQDSGMAVTCIDLSPEMIKLCLQKGLSARVMDMTTLEFPPNTFDAVYSLNNLLHIPTAEFRTVLENIKGVLKQGGLFYLGVYGREDEFEGPWEYDKYEPKRFFSFHSDEYIQSQTSALFKSLYFKHIPTGENGLHFQSLILEKSDIQKNEQAERLLIT